MSFTDPYKDHELLSRIANGDEAAFTQFFKATANRMRAQVQHFIKDGFGITEVLQESFIKIWLNREKLTEIEHPEAYLRRLVLNECFNYLNRLSRQEKLHQVLEPSPVPSQIHAEEMISFKETAQIIQQTIEALPDQRRKIYQLSRNAGLNSTEIAAQMNLTPDYVRKAISAARQTIKTELAKAGKLFLAILLLF